MDPTLIKAIRHLLVAQKNAAAAEMELSPQDQDAFIREETRGKFGLPDAQKFLAQIDSGINARNLTSSALQGATLDFGDEIVGALPEMLGGGEAAKEEMRLRQDLFREKHGKADLAAGLAGGIGTSFLPVGGALKGLSSVGQGIRRGAAIGAGYGALAGAGRGEGLRQRAEQAATGGVGGAILGAAIPEIGVGAKMLFSGAARAQRRIGNAIEHSGGKQKLLDRVAEFESAGKGGDVMVPDLTPETKALADFGATNSTSTFNDLEGKLVSRQADQSNRLGNDVEDVLGSRPDAALTRERHEGKLAQWAKSAYDKLRNNTPNFDVRRLYPLITQPKVSTALEEARVNGLIGDTPEIGGNLTFQNVQDLKERLADLTSAAFRAGKGNLGARLKEAHRTVSNALEEHVPGYKEVNAKYMRRMKVNNLIEQGENEWKAEDSRHLKRFVSSLKRDELAALRIGMASKLVNRLRSVAKNRGEGNNIMMMGETMQDKLKLIFGTEERFTEFMRRASLEADMGKSMSVVRGSQTAQRLQAAGHDPLETVGHLAHGIGSVGTRAARMGLQAGTAALRGKTASEVGPFVGTKGADSIRQLLEEWNMRSPMLGQYLTRTLPAAGGLLVNKF